MAPECQSVLRLVGIMGVHVDDTAVGGHGPMFKESIESIRKRFPYRKWRGEFCGAWYNQGSDFSIHMSMELFTDKLRPINVPKNTKPDDPLSASQVKILRAVSGSLSWLSSQARPDLCVQTSLSQQAFPRPRIEDFRRAKQNSQMGVTFPSIK